LDRVATDAAIFDRCYTSNSPCAPSRAALFSGRFGINNGVVGHHGYADKFRYPGTEHWDHGADKPMLMRHLRLNGVKTVSFSNFADRHKAWWFASGWSELHTFNNKMGTESADEVTAAVLPWLEKHAGEDNFFLHIHYWDPHCDYHGHDNGKWFKEMAKYDPPKWPDADAIKRNMEIYGPRTALDLYTPRLDDTSPNEYMPDKIDSVDKFKMLIDGYDSEIRYTDHHIGQVLDMIEKKFTWDDTVFIISGDHGDSFGEHGVYMDHTIANEAVHHIPLIMRIPGVTKKSRCSEYMYNIDLCPTLCDLYGFPKPEHWDGTSFFPALQGKSLNGRENMVWDHGIYTFTRSVRSRKWLFMRVLHPGLYPYDKPYMLYDMDNDPYMTTDVAAKYPEIVNQHEHVMNDWWHEQTAKHGDKPDNLQLMVSTGPFIYCQPEQMLARLKNRGFDRQAKELVERLKKFHPDRKFL
jgi:arylsulfatase A-like enzyme